MVRESFLYALGIQFPIYGYLNWIAIISEIIFIGLFFRSSQINFSIKNFLLLVIYAIIVYTSNSLQQNNIGHYVFFATILPAILLSFINYSRINILNLMRSFLKVYNPVIGIILVIGVLDYFIGGLFNNFLKSYFYNDLWSEMVDIENKYNKFRMFTIIGTPLMNAFYALVLLCMNLVYKKLSGSMIGNQILIYLISISAIIATGSRAALFISIAVIIVSEFYGKVYTSRLVLLLIGSLILLNTSFFQETAGNRLNLGFNNDSDARYQLFQLFLNNKFGEINYFSGGGYNYSRELTSSITKSQTMQNFEYPILMFLYDYGIVATIIYYFFFLLLPILAMVKFRQRYYLFIYCSLFAFLQTCNMTAQFYDFNLQLSFVFILIAQSVNQVKRKIIVA